MPNCRVCGKECRSIGSVEYYTGFPFEIMQCDACGCRSTTSDPDVYDRLYSQQKSIYGIYDEASAQAEALFKRNDLVGLQYALQKSPKYNFVVSQAIHLPLSAKVLEIGASRGHLASYFILRGNKVVGSDVSREAVRKANETFGQHFHHIDSPEIEASAPYDFIYHVGTVGCVADPIGLTKRLLGMLAPKGTLAFNAPLLEACYLKDQLWNDAANPPDLVTLFPSGFFARTFGGDAQVEERFDYVTARENLRISLRRTFGQWKKPVPIPLNSSMSDYQTGRHSESFPERVALKLANVSGLLQGKELFPGLHDEAPLHRWMKKRPAPFGYYVTMRRARVPHIELDQPVLKTSA